MSTREAGGNPANTNSQALSRILIIGRHDSEKEDLCSLLGAKGFEPMAIENSGDIISRIFQLAPELALVEIEDVEKTRELCEQIKSEIALPIIGLVGQNKLKELSDRFDDFILAPYRIDELVTRINRLLHKDSRTEPDEAIRVKDLVIDQANCQVTMTGRLVELTFKEYELLRFLAANPDRVFTRDTLLNKVWGYDYFGGDRTVDVHIRRLRSKIEDPDHTFIETVRNIGYRFR